MPVKPRSKRKITTNPDGSPVMVGANPVEDKIAALADQIIERAKNTPETTPEAAKEEIIENSSAPKPTAAESTLDEAPKDIPKVAIDNLPDKTPKEQHDETTGNEVINKTLDSTPDQAKKYNREPLISTPPTPSPSSAAAPPPENISPQIMQNMIVEEDVPLEKKNRRLFLIGSIFLIAILISTVGFIQLLKSNSGQAQKTIVPPTAMPVTVTPAFNKSEWTVEVLNGSGTTGLAKKYSQILEKMGYRVVKTGNADKKTYKANELYVRKEMTTKAIDFISNIQSDIKVGSVTGELKDSTATARIIIGKE